MKHLRDIFRRRNLFLRTNFDQLYASFVPPREEAHNRFKERTSCTDLCIPPWASSKRSGSIGAPVACLLTYPPRGEKNALPWNISTHWKRNRGGSAIAEAITTDLRRLATNTWCSEGDASAIETWKETKSNQEPRGLALSRKMRIPSSARFQIHVDLAPSCRELSRVFGNQHLQADRVSTD